MVVRACEMPETPQESSAESDITCYWTKCKHSSILTSIQNTKSLKFDLLH
jgi:hypothetical protein